MQELICPRCRRGGFSKRCAHDGAYLVTPAALREAGRDAWLGEFLAGRYGIIQRLGVGGMGAVYAAWDEETQRKIAVKFLLDRYAQHPSLRTRFIREAEAAASVNSPHVVALLDFGVEADQTLWYAMEFVEGWTLRDEVNHNGALTVRQSVQLARQILMGLAEAHDAGLIHRDLKHDNIMFSGTRGRFMARILDFGVVKSQAADLDHGNPLTAHGVLVGSPSYMSPEQIRNLEVGPPSDLYSLAVVLYEALVARRLFSASDYEALLREDATREAPPLTYTANGEEIPLAYDKVIQKALAHDPTDRYPDARTMLLALEQMEVAPPPPDDLLADPPEAARLEDAPSVIVSPSPVPIVQETGLPVIRVQPTPLKPPKRAWLLFVGVAALTLLLAEIGLRLAGR
ncbi:serine/threonine protein kinase [Myxococcota bacterium]|nr:serine/threonine protein kinase [Myxococcota bacterium]MBU1431858.1 serine/threonine protein kinase [Myxococcota bacterium]MBU1898998.1 serine/threonine protein kinase [Myxococcota bacterium]